jgi:hypothetical protein
MNMKKEGFADRIAIGYAPVFMPKDHSSSASYAQDLNTLYIHTRILANNVVSLYLHLAACRQNDLTSLLSKFQVDLFSQAEALQQELSVMGIETLPQENWGDHAALWRISDMGNQAAAVNSLIEASNELSEKYEQLIPEAMKRTDHAVSFYMLANHQSAISKYMHLLERSQP